MSDTDDLESKSPTKRISGVCNFLVNFILYSKIQNGKKNIMGS